MTFDIKFARSELCSTVFFKHSLFCGTQDTMPFCNNSVKQNRLEGQIKRRGGENGTCTNVTSCGSLRGRRPKGGKGERRAHEAREDRTRVVLPPFLRPATQARAVGVMQTRLRLSSDDISGHQKRRKNFNCESSRLFSPLSAPQSERTMVKRSY